MLRILKLGKLIVIRDWNRKYNLDYLIYISCVGVIIVCKNIYFCYFIKNIVL